MTSEPRKPLIAGNWKMHLDQDSAAELARSLARRVSRARHCEVAVFPPHPLIPAVARVLEGTGLAVGGQDLSAHAQGAYTGEVSGRMLASVGCSHVLVGHSERREYHLETDELVHDKVAMALEAGLVPVVCVGEKLSERDSGMTLRRIETQVHKALDGLEGPVHERLVLAYEPVWAIGTGRTATPAQAEEVHEFIRGVVRSMFGDEAAAGIRILYGGSVKPDNAPALMSQADVDGALVGGASLDAESFASIVFYRE